MLSGENKTKLHYLNKVIIVINNNNSSNNNNKTQEQVEMPSQDFNKYNHQLSK